MAEYVFTLRNVRKAHGDKVVLDNVTLSFLHGAKIGVVGPNGTGKSTLLKIMAGLEPTTATPSSTPTRRSGCSSRSRP
jgi:ATPase subunit of ABC transporter with duplicated ATPase domains